VCHEHNIECELVAKVAVLKVDYFGHVVRRSAGQRALTVLEVTMEANGIKGSLTDSGLTPSSRGWEKTSYY